MAKNTHKTNPSEGLQIDPIHEAVDIYSQSLTDEIWQRKYRYGFEKVPEDTNLRVVKGVYAKDPDQTAQRRALDALNKLLFIPGGRIIAGAGTPHAVTLINCYVSRTIGDSMPDIMDALKEAALTQQQGGGIGMDFSTIRPAGAYLRRTGAVASGPLHFMDMWDAMCQTIKSAGGRRGAMMATLHCEHPDLMDFIVAKQQKGRLTNFNVSVLVTDAFMDAVENDEDWFLGFHEPRADGVHLFETVRDDDDAIQAGKWYAYSKHRARDIWDAILHNTYEYAEPGVIFIDRINQTNNLRYIEHIMCTNPCVAGDTMILTSHGQLPIQLLADVPVHVWNGEQFSRVTPFSTGMNEVMEITFSNGATIKATLYHRWKLAEGKVVETHQLEIGDKLVYKDMPTVELDHPVGYAIDAYSQGFYCGDGTRNATESNLYKHEQSIMDRLIGKCTQRNCVDQPGHRWHHGKMYDKNFVPLRGNIEYCVNWLAGLLDADGCLVKKQSGYVLELSAKDREFLRTTGLMLNRLGVNYRIWERKDAGLKNGSNGIAYMCESTASLMISAHGAHHLYSLGMRCSRLNTEVFAEAPKGKANVGHRVVDIKRTGEVVETFCFTEPVANMGIFNGIPAMNCGEQPLPPYACCNLGAVNLARMVRNPFTRDAYFDFNLMQDVVSIGMRFLDNVIDVTLYPLEEQAQEEYNKRRTGLGITGLADAMAQLGFAYNSPEALEFTEKVMRTLRDAAYMESAMLAQERGAFPLYDKEQWGTTSPVVQDLPFPVKSAIKDFGIRNSVLLTIAPTGTTSIYAGNVSSGLEPIFKREIRRNVRQADESTKQFIAYDYAALLWRAINGGKPYPTYMTEHDELIPMDHLRIQAICQKYIDASISKTINCPKEMSFEEFGEVYAAAYKMGCKGCTTYRPSDIRGEVLVSSPSTAEAKKSDHELYAIEGRPEALTGQTYKVSWPSENASYYITVNNTPDGKPFEMFIHSTSSKYTDWTTALSLMISAIMRKGEDISFIPKELAKVASAHNSGFVKQKYYSSLAALIGAVLDNHLQAVTAPQRAEKQGEQREQSGDPVYQLPAGEINTTGEKCDECGAHAMIPIEGCLTCTNCGYAKCG